MKKAKKAGKALKRKFMKKAGKGAVKAMGNNVKKAVEKVFEKM